MKVASFAKNHPKVRLHEIIRTQWSNDPHTSTFSVDVFASDWVRMSTVLQVTLLISFLPLWDLVRDKCTSLDFATKLVGKN